LVRSKTRAKIMVRPPKVTVERLPAINDPRRQLPFRFRSYDELTADLGRTDALASSIMLAVEYFTNDAEKFAKDVAEERRRAASAAGTAELPFTDDDKLRAMWTFGNREAERFAINTANPAFPILRTHAVQLLLVGVYQQAEVFLNGVRDELREMGHEWSPRGNKVPLLEYTLENLPDGLSANKIRLGCERYDLFEYYRLMRNAFAHGPSDHKKIAKHFQSVKHYRATVLSEFGLAAPNSFDLMSLDDYQLFTRLLKYIATDICRIGEPSDEALVKLIEWNGGKVEQPLARFVLIRQFKANLRASLSRWFKARYALKLQNRPSALDALVEYVEKVPNQRARRKMKRVVRL
jgi:hypothetical protein